MPAPKKYPDELRERGVRLALESSRPIAHVAQDLGVHRETLRLWVRQAQADAGSRNDRLTSDERERMKALVAFVGQEREGSDTYYRFCGFATVETRTSQDQIWNDERYAVYRQYLNLLVKPAGESGAFRHSETHPGDVHDDWLERLICRTGYSWANDDFEAWIDTRCEKTVTPGVDRTPSGQTIRFAWNYIIFAASPPETMILADPPLIAVQEQRMGVAEQWLDEPLANDIKELVRGRAKNPERGLRSSPTGFQHSFMPLKGRAGEWRSAMGEVLRRHRLDVLQPAERRRS